MSNVTYGLLILSSKYLAHKSHLGSKDFMSVETERDFENYLVLSQYVLHIRKGSQRAEDVERL